MSFDLYVSVLIPSLLFGAAVTLGLAAPHTKVSWLKGLFLLPALRFGLFHSVLFGANLICTWVWRAAECSAVQWFINVSLATLLVSVFESLAIEVLMLIRRARGAPLGLRRSFVVSLCGYAATILSWIGLWIVLIGQSLGTG